MVREQLYINGIEVELMGSLQPNLTYNIQDIEKPDKRKATFSKSVNLPGSKTINNLFNFIFEISTEGTFNPNIKATAKYMVDSQMILDGILQLKNIKYLDNSKIEYEVVLLGTIANLFTELGELELTDIQDLSDFDHPYNETHQALTWDTSTLFQGGVVPFQMGQGYLYPMINYGADNTLDSYDYNEMYPAMFVKELWDRIFTDAGYTYTSNFLNSDKRFKNAVIPYNGTGFGMTTSQLDDRTFDADTPTFLSSMTGITTTGALSYMDFTDVTDPGGVHTGGTFTAPATGQYKFQSDIAFNATFYPDPTATETVRSNTKLRVFLVFEKNGGIDLDSDMIFISPDYTYDFPIAGSYTTSTTPTYPDDEYNKNVTGTTPYTLTNKVYNPPNRMVLNTNTLWLNAGDTIRVRIAASPLVIENGILGYFSTSNSNEYAGTADLNITGTGSFSNQPINTEYMYNDTVDMNGAIPKNIKQKDFVMSIINKFKLSIEPDNDNPNNLLIEERDSFLTASVEDWSKKLDVSQDLVFTPMGLLDAGRYLFKHKDDKDYYNEMYKSTYDETYGEREIIVDNDFISKTNKLEIIFSPTPLVGQDSNDRVVSTILKTNDNGEAQRTDSNIRYLIYDGLKDTSSLWTHRTTVRDTYPYAGHLYPDPFNPTIDINFGLPREIYYDNTFYPIALTDNNLYNSLHRKEVEEITDADSKIVKGMFYLTPLDISNLSFRPQYYFNRAYHRLLKVVNYNPANVALTECHFLKLKTAETYTPITLVPGGKNETVGSGGSQEPVPTKSLSTTKLADRNAYDKRNATVDGEDNYVNDTARAVKITGDRNTVSANTKNINIQGNDNGIAGNLENITLINTNNTTITESDITYINGVAQSGDSVVKQKSADFTTELATTTYVVDTSAGDVTIRFETFNIHDGKVWIIKKPLANNKIIIEDKLTNYTIDTKTSQKIKGKNDGIQFQLDRGSLNFNSI